MTTSNYLLQVKDSPRPKIKRSLWNSFDEIEARLRLMYQDGQRNLYLKCQKDGKFSFGVMKVKKENKVINEDYLVLVDYWDYERHNSTSHNHAVVTIAKMLRVVDEVESKNNLKTTL